MKKLLLPALLAGLTLASGPASAQRLTTGNSVIWAGLNGNQAQLIGPTAGSGNAFESGELGLHLAYSYFLTPEWTLVGSGGFDLGNNQFKPTTGPTEKFTSNSWNLRLGFDRYAFINDGVAVYAGPGVQLWRGKGEFDGSGSPVLDREWPTVRQIAFNGRMGLWARFARHYALFGHIGQVIGANSGDDGNGKNSWWSNHHEGSVGVAVDL